LGITGIGKEIHQGLQRKTPLLKARMRNGKFRALYDRVPTEKYVDIQRPFSPSPFLGAVPAVTAFQQLNCRKQLSGTAGKAAAYRAVKKSRLIRHIKRGGFINRGYPEILQNTPQVLTGGKQ
jgi:hypothetical protein